MTGIAEKAHKISAAMVLNVFISMMFLIVLLLFSIDKVNKRTVL